MARGEHTELHVGCDRGICPLSGIELDRVELRDVEVRLRPSSGVRQDAEVQEHAEAQVDIGALIVFEGRGIDEPPASNGAISPDRRWHQSPGGLSSPRRSQARQLQRPRFPPLALDWLVSLLHPLCGSNAKGSKAVVRFNQER